MHLTWVVSEPATGPRQMRPVRPRTAHAHRAGHGAAVRHRVQWPHHTKGTHVSTAVCGRCRV